MILNDISFKIEKGQRVAFVGESGSGKTTLAKLLLNMYQIEKGNIFIDGKDIRDIQIENLRDKIAYVSQETFLFSGTIWENLTLGISEEDVDEVVETCKKAQAYEFINDFPLRYETKLHESGNHDELIKYGGKYAELVKQQSL